MQAQSCQIDDDCPYLYSCQQGFCKHNPILPVSVWTVFVYLFMGVACSIVNISGNSIGLFKVLILLIMLNYTLDQGTGLSQAMVAGTAISNFLSIIFKPHPNGITSLVNFKLLTVMIPCSVFGATFGALIQSFTPAIVQVSILICVFSFFIYKFVLKFKNATKAAKVEKSLLEKQGQKEQQQQQRKQYVTNESITLPQQQVTTPLLQPSDQISQKIAILKYQKSYHWPQLLQIAIVFITFQTLSLLVQGKLSILQVNRCSVWFFLGLAGLWVIKILYLYFIKKYMNRAYARYRKHNIPQQVYLDHKRSFLRVAFGALIAGFIQGLLGMGAGICLMMVMLSFPIDPTSAAATSGSQYLFTGGASLMQYYTDGKVQLFESLWCMGICCLLGGIMTVLVRRFMSRLPKSLVDRIILGNIIMLCSMSAILSVPNIVRTIIRDGWQQVLKIHFKCA